MTPAEQRIYSMFENGLIPWWTRDRLLAEISAKERTMVSEASDPLGRWCEKHGVSFSMACKSGEWIVTARHRSVLTRNGDQLNGGFVMKSDKDPAVALREAVAALMRLMENS